MLLFKTLVCILLAYAGMSSAKNCKTQGKPLVTCRSCPASVCVAKFTNKPGREYNLGCKDPEGEKMAKNANWMYLPARDCYIWAGRFDRESCHPGSLPRCCVNFGSGGAAATATAGGGATAEAGAGPGGCGCVAGG